MLRIVNASLAGLALWVLCAAGLKAQTTIAANSCNVGDVQKAVNSASAGDTVTVPAGAAGTCVWNSALTVSKGISIIGAGEGSTIIESAVSTEQFLSVSLPSSSSSFRLSAMTLEPAPGLVAPGSGAFPIIITGTCGASGCSTVHLDNLLFTGWVNNVSGETNSFDDYLLGVNDCFGVLDHITGNFASHGIFMEIGLGSYLGVGTYGDESWAQPDDYGSANALYIEDSSFQTTANMDVADSAFPGNGGGRYVIRHNNLLNFNISNHGTETTGRTRSGRSMEVYDNSFDCTSGSGGCNVPVAMRGGTSLVYDNTITHSNPGSWNDAVSVSTYRRWAAATPWETCDGQGQWDQNDGTVYYSGTALSTTTTKINPGGLVGIVTDKGSPGWTTNSWTAYSIVDTTQGWGGEIWSNTANTITYIGFTGISSQNVVQTLAPGDKYEILQATACIDQPGRGPGTLLSGSTASPTGWVNEPVDPVYEWGDTSDSSIPWIASYHEPALIANRDFYYQNPSFNGTSGTGTGLLANRPATCAPNPAGQTIPGVAYWATDANNGNGELYVCEGTPGNGSWVAQYTPYRYPYLSAGPDPPSNLVVAVH